MIIHVKTAVSWIVWGEIANMNKDCTAWKMLSGVTGGGPKKT